MRPLYLILALFALITLASAMNLTNMSSSVPLNETLTGISDGAQGFVEQVKLVVPYEIWMALAIVFFFTTFMARTSINHQTHIWKLGLYLGFALFIGLIIMSL